MFQNNRKNMDRAPYYGTFFVQQLPSSLISPWSSRWPRWQYLSLSNCLKTQRRTIQEHHLHFIRLIETKRQICQIFRLLRYLFSLCLIYIYPCNSHHIYSKHWGWSLPLNFINPKLLLTFTDFPNAQLGAWFTCVSENHSFKNKQFDLKQWWGKYILLLNKRRAGL